MNELITAIGRPLMLIGIVIVVPFLARVIVRELTATGREP